MSAQTPSPRSSGHRDAASRRCCARSTASMKFIPTSARKARSLSKARTSSIGATRSRNFGARSEWCSRSRPRSSPRSATTSHLRSAITRNCRSPRSTTASRTRFGRRHCGKRSRTSSTTALCRCREASSNACALPAPSRCVPRSSCWMKRPRRWIRSRPPRSRS